MPCRSRASSDCVFVTSPGAASRSGPDAAVRCRGAIVAAAPGAASRRTVPHGHGNTTTFTGALRLLGMTAPMVRAGATNGAAWFHLPRGSPDLDPIGNVFAKLKAPLRRITARAMGEGWDAIRDAWPGFSATECAKYFTATGYEPGWGDFAPISRAHNSAPSRHERERKDQSIYKYIPCEKRCGEFLYKPNRDFRRRFMSLEKLFTHSRDFLKMNLVYMIGVFPLKAGIYNFKFTNASDLHQNRCSRKSKHFWKGDHNITVWYASLASDSERGSAAFYLPYEPNSLHRSALPSDAPLLLTASMTGCTFGMVQYRGGSIEVCHANFLSDDGQLDKARLSRETSWCPIRLEDSHYREHIRGKPVIEQDSIKTFRKQASLGATIIGSNKPGRGWNIYAQQWENKDGSNFIYHDLIELFPAKK